MLTQNIRQVSWILAMFGLLWVLAACSNQANLAYAEVTSASLEPGGSIPTPSGAVILSLSGDISVQNSGDVLKFDMATLERLGLVEYTIADPWKDHENVTYTGVLVSDLLEYAGALDSATNIRVVALDDYAVDISIEDINKWPVLLATRSGGQYMDIENAGPTRIVFPFHAHPEIDEDAYKVLMAWNLKEIEIQ